MRPAIAVPFAIGFAISWVLFAGLAAWEIRDPHGSYKVLRDWSLKFGTPFEEPDLWMESVKEGTLRTLPFLLAMIAAIPLRRRGWRGVAITGAFAAGILWLLQGAFYHSWTFWHIAPLAVAVAGLPAADVLTLGKVRSGRTKMVLFAPLVGFLLVWMVQEVVMMLVANRFRFRPMTPVYILSHAVYAVPMKFLPWLPMLLAWLRGVPPLEAPDSKESA